MARSTARKRALNTLYEADEKGQEILSLLDERIAYPGAPTPLPEYAIEIVRGVASHRRTIDHALNDASTSWEVKRMPVVDRNLARMATWEIVYNDEIPAGVAIDEAIALAKILSDDGAPSFLFGILSTIERNASAIIQEEIEWQEMRARLAAERDGVYTDTDDDTYDDEHADSHDFDDSVESESEIDTNFSEEFYPDIADICVQDFEDPQNIENSNDSTLDKQ